LNKNQWIFEGSGEPRDLNVRRGYWCGVWGDVSSSRNFFVIFRCKIL